MCRVERLRRQHRQNLLAEMQFDRSFGLTANFTRVDDRDTFLGKLLTQLLPELLLVGH